MKIKTEVIIFSNQKGGVGKTTLARELGIYLAGRGHMVLLIDCDPQGNLTRGLTEEEADGPGLYEAIEGGAISFTKINENLELLRGDVRLASLEKSLIGEIDAYLKLKELFASDHLNKYELIFLDTPPSLGVLTINALTAANYLVIPMRPALYTLQGTNDLMAAVAKVKKTLNPELNLLGVIINGYESIPIITREITKEIEESFKEKVFKTVLSKSIKIEEAIAEKTGVTELKKLDKSRAKDEVARIGSELLVRLGNKGGKGWLTTG
jgi:chromosome partitioning protein